MSFTRRTVDAFNLRGKKAINANFKNIETELGAAQDDIETAQDEIDLLPELRIARVQLTNAQVLALRATPITIVAAPGAGYILEFVSGVGFLDYTAAYTESADNIALRYTDGSGATLATFETTGWLTATADTLAYADRAAALIVAKSGSENKALVLHNNGDGELGGGNAANKVTIEIVYRIVPVTDASSVAGW